MTKGFEDFNSCFGTNVEQHFKTENTRSDSVTCFRAYNIFKGGGRSFRSSRSSQYHAGNFRPEETLRQMQDIIRMVAMQPNLWRGKTW
jgi:hypothetical protein